MTKDMYHIFAEDGKEKGYRPPKIHVITSGIKMYGEWHNMISLMKNMSKLENMVTVYQVPEHMKKMKMYRDLKPKEVETWIKDLAEARENENYHNKGSPRR